MNEGLKPCPFCGSEAIRTTFEGIIYCGNCVCNGPSRPTKDESIAAWNTRTKPETRGASDPATTKEQ